MCGATDTVTLQHTGMCPMYCTVVGITTVTDLAVFHSSQYIVF